MKFAIIGTGFIFRKHIQAIYKTEGKIVDVVDRAHGQEAWKEMVKDAEADCIVVLAPNNLHFEMAKFSSDRGKIVLCEKPLVIKSERARVLAEKPNIFTVYQLRYHPSAKALKEEIKKDKNYDIKLDISVHRDESYWKSWKGNIERTGGILFNIGIHYFDLLLYLFGKPAKILVHSLSKKRGSGEIKGGNYLCHWKINAEATKEAKRRVFKVNGISYDFSSKENLHVYVYKDLLRKKGVTPKEALPSIELIEKIYAQYKK